VYIILVVSVVSVCQTITFEASMEEVHICTSGRHEIRVKFVYEGRRVKVITVKVTGAKKSKIPIPAM